jgi:hypothetical protein
MDSDVLIPINHDIAESTVDSPFIIGPHGKLGFLKGGALEEKIYRRTDRSDIGGS